jgi:hypothetical protein
VDVDVLQVGIHHDRPDSGEPTVGFAYDLGVGDVDQGANVGLGEELTGHGVDPMSR